MDNGRSRGGKAIHKVAANPKHSGQHNQFYSTACLPNVSFLQSHMVWTDDQVTCKRCIAAIKAVKP